MSDLPGPIEWEGRTTKLVRYVSLPRNPNFPYDYRRKKGALFYEVANRRIGAIYIHQTAGSNRDGQEACDRLANWIIRSPRFESRSGKVRRVGGGRGFPGAPYPFLIPYRPTVHEGKSVVYRLWDDQWVTWHTRRCNRIGTGVAFAGSFATRHAPRFSTNHPHTMAMDAGAELIEDYLLPRYGLTTDDVRGHFDAGKIMCPGDALEAWVRRGRGETVSWMDDAPGNLVRTPLETMAQKRKALSDLGFGGFELREYEGFRMAVEAAQEAAGIVVDGIWGRQTEAGVRRLLTAHSTGSTDT